MSTFDVYYFIFRESVMGSVWRFILIERLKNLYTMFLFAIFFSTLNLDLWYFDSFKSIWVWLNQIFIGFMLWNSIIWFLFFISSFSFSLELINWFSSLRIWCLTSSVSLILLLHYIKHTQFADIQQNDSIKQFNLMDFYEISQNGCVSGVYFTIPLFINEFFYS